MTRLGRAAALVAVFLFGDLLLPPVPPPPPLPFSPRGLETLPPRTSGRGAHPGDPLNLIFSGTQTQIRRALSAGGWTEIPIPYTASVRAGLSDLLFRGTLDRFPPMTVYHVLGRPQDMNWAQVITPVLKRHHFRLWRTGLRDGAGREIWWGSGNYDLSVRWTDLTHRPDPNMNEERAFVARSLENVPSVESLRLIKLPQIPLRGSNECAYDFFTDGKALLVELEPTGPAGSRAVEPPKK